MKRGGHVTGRRGSHGLRDSVQIHATLKRRMRDSEKVGPALQQLRQRRSRITPRHERRGHAEDFHQRFGFPKTHKVSVEVKQREASGSGPVRSGLQQRGSAVRSDRLGAPTVRQQILLLPLGTSQSDSPTHRTCAATHPHRPGTMTSR